MDINHSRPASSQKPFSLLYLLGKPLMRVAWHSKLSDFILVPPAWLDHCYQRCNQNVELCHHGAHLHCQHWVVRYDCQTSVASCLVRKVHKNIWSTEQITCRCLKYRDLASIKLIMPLCLLSAVNLYFLVVQFFCCESVAYACGKWANIVLVEAKFFFIEWWFFRHEVCLVEKSVFWLIHVLFIHLVIINYI